MDLDGYTGAIARTETAQEAGERLTDAGYQPVIDHGSLTIDDGQATVTPYDGVNQLGDRFSLWCIYDQSGELTRCVARGPDGSCPPRH